MRIGGGGSDNANILQSDDVTFRNHDAEVDAGRCFFVTTLIGAQAANFGHVQLWNPVGSNRVVLLDEITVGVSSAMIVRYGFHNTELTGISVTGHNKINGDTAALAGSRVQVNASIFGLVQNSLRMAGSNSLVLALRNPYRLAAGEGFMFAGATVQISLVLAFGWREFIV